MTFCELYLNFFLLKRAKVSIHLARRASFTTKYVRSFDNLIDIALPRPKNTGFLLSFLDDIPQLEVADVLFANHLSFKC